MLRKVEFSSILGGISNTYHDGGDNQYVAALGIDPDQAVVSGSQIRTSGIITPLAYTKFSGGALTGVPLWMMTTAKDDKFYVHLNNGRLVQYSNTFGSETNLATAASSSGNGSAYYNNYIYMMTNTDVSRWGPIDGTAALTDNVWTGTTLGSQTATTNTTYPTTRQIGLPNHAAHVHTDGNLYFCDVLNGQGVLHKITTKKVTAEGDTNNGSAFNVMQLPFGWYPTDIESYGTDLAITAIQSVTTGNPILAQGRSALFLWDTFSALPYKQIALADPLATAILNVNGELKVFTGNANSGSRLSRYLGGESLTASAFLEEGVSPFAGAIDSFGSRTTFGASTTYPQVSASCFSVGSKDGMEKEVLHNTVMTTSVGLTPVVTCLKYATQASGLKPVPVVGWTDSATQGIDKYSPTGTLLSVWRSRIVDVGTKFSFQKVYIVLDKTLGAGMSITPKLFIDDESSSTTLAVINSTNYSGRTTIVYRRPELPNTFIGDHNFMVELQWASTAAVSVIDMEVVIDVYADRKR